jgi:histidyl-tRNA synthetase
MQYGRPDGTFDIVPPVPCGRKEARSFVNDSACWLYVESVFRTVCKSYGFSEIRTPIFEQTDLFHRAVGDGTDIVAKETYDLVTRGGDRLTLRPEGTAGAIRAYVSERLWIERPIAKLLYIGPNFRYERAQRGRYRQHHQAGVEVLGASIPSIDAEIIDLAVAFYTALGITDLTVKVNSVGTKESRVAYLEALKAYAEPLLSEMSDDNKRRFEQNPLRMLDSKDKRDIALLEDAPNLIDFLDDASAEHFEKVCTYLTALGIPYEVDHRLVRGFDYYTRTAFEIQSTVLGDKALGGGGRYNQLVEQLGGPATAGIGFGLGIERVLITMEELGLPRPGGNQLDAFICPMGDAARDASTTIASNLRQAGLCIDVDYLGRRLKSMLEMADAGGAKYAIVIGDDEIAAQTVSVRELATQSQHTVALVDLAAFIKG